MSFKKTYNEKSTIFVNTNYFSMSWFIIFTLFLSFSIIYFDYMMNNMPKIANISILNINNKMDNINSTRNVVPITLNIVSNVTAEKIVSENSDECAGKYIYVQKLPSRFNDDIVKKCSALNQWANMCKSITNSGLGPRLNVPGWFATDQFSLEIVFYNRMKKYRCLTEDSSKANAVFVPFYAGLDVGRYLWNNDSGIRDARSNELVKFLREKPEWKRLYGHDHFMVAGRISWDFRRESDKGSDWGNHLFLLPEVKNMTNLLIESSPWSKIDFAIPYPTYFHPSSDKQMYNWQKGVRKQKRPYFYSFAGAPRPHLKDSIRNEVINQCVESKCNCCKLINCNTSSQNCREPMNVINLFRKSVFCLQPPGDSYTRRSAFDSILAGCIPVFFHPGSAYVQYLWHLPKNYSKYSVFIPMEDVKMRNYSIEKRLLSIPKDEIKEMRDEVIKLIPRIVYAHPNYRLKKYEDAFDVTVNEVLKRITEIKDGISNNSTTYESFPEEFSWKYRFGGLDNHEWDAYFART